MILRIHHVVFSLAWLFVFTIFRTIIIGLQNNLESWHNSFFQTLQFYPLISRACCHVSKSKCHRSQWNCRKLISCNFIGSGNFTTSVIWRRSSDVGNLVVACCHVCFERAACPQPLTYEMVVVIMKMNWSSEKRSSWTIATDCVLQSHPWDIWWFVFVLLAG